MSRTVILEDIDGNEITLIVPDTENPDFYALPVATSDDLGVVKPDGTTISINGSGVVTANISGKEDIAKAMNILETSGTITLTDNSVNRVTPTGNITFTLPTVTDLTVFHQILVQINLSTVYTINVGTTYYFNGTAPNLSTVGVYDLIFEYDNSNGYWVCGLLTKGFAS